MFQPAGTHHHLFRIGTWVTLAAFLGGSVIPPGASLAQGVSVAGVVLPAPGTMVMPTPSFAPAVMRGIRIFPNEPLRFDFIIDTGNTGFNDEDFKSESERLIRYFLAAVTIPEDDLWVNLSPYEQDRIVPSAFGQTEMGRDLLAQDYLLKQLTASLLYPEKDLGHEFWERVRARVRERFGTADVTVNTFNKVWVIPDRAVVYESGDVAFIMESHLKVMLEEDYLAMSEAQASSGRSATNSAGADRMGHEIIREVILPEIEREVNEGAHFVSLRQIYHSMILATWFKRNLRASVLGRVYVERNKIGGVEIDDAEAGKKIYAQYLAAFKKGAYNYIKEEYDRTTDRMIPRKYFSGGVRFGQATDNAMIVESGPAEAMLSKAAAAAAGPMTTVESGMRVVRDEGRLGAGEGARAPAEASVDKPADESTPRPEPRAETRTADRSVGETLSVRPETANSERDGLRGNDGDKSNTVFQAEVPLPEFLRGVENEKIGKFLPRLLESIPEARRALAEQVRHVSDGNRTGQEFSIEMETRDAQLLISVQSGERYNTGYGGNVVVHTHPILRLRDKDNQGKRTGIGYRSILDTLSPTPDSFDVFRPGMIVAGSEATGYFALVYDLSETENRRWYGEIGRQKVARHDRPGKIIELGAGQLFKIVPQGDEVQLQPISVAETEVKWGEVQRAPEKKRQLELELNLRPHPQHPSQPFRAEFGDGFREVMAFVTNGEYYPVEIIGYQKNPRQGVPDGYTHLLDVGGTEGFDYRFVTQGHDKNSSRSNQYSNLARLQGVLAQFGVAVSVMQIEVGTKNVQIYKPHLTSVGISPKSISQLHADRVIEELAKLHAAGIVHNDLIGAGKHAGLNWQNVKFEMDSKTQSPVRAVFDGSGFEKAEAYSFENRFLADEFYAVADALLNDLDINDPQNREKMTKTWFERHEKIIGTAGTNRAETRSPNLAPVGETRSPIGSEGYNAEARAEVRSDTPISHRELTLGVETSLADPDRREVRGDVTESLSTLAPEWVEIGLKSNVLVRDKATKALSFRNKAAGDAWAAMTRSSYASYSVTGLIEKEFSTKVSPEQLKQLILAGRVTFDADVGAFRASAAEKETRIVLADGQGLSLTEDALALLYDKTHARDEAMPATLIDVADLSNPETPAKQPFKADDVLSMILKKQVPAGEVMLAQPMPDGEAGAAHQTAPKETDPAASGSDAGMISAADKGKTDGGAAQNPGGIDLNPGHLDLQTRGEGMDALPWADIESLETVPFDGFVPVILNVVPTNLPMFMGAAGAGSEFELSRVP